jgi:hypothetical protein
MATTTHTDAFDPQTEAEFARIEADAAAAERDSRIEFGEPIHVQNENGVNIVTYSINQISINAWIVAVAWGRHPNTHVESVTVADREDVENLIQIIKGVANA